MRIFQESPRPASSPWGAIDYAKQTAPGLWCVGTAGHGGYQLSQERRLAMPKHLKEVYTFAGGNWYEEDCDWCLIALAFPEAFAPEAQEQARRTLAHYLTIPDYAPPGSVYYKSMSAAARAQAVLNAQIDLPLPPSAVDVGTISEYGLTQKLSTPVRVF